MNSVKRYWASGNSAIWIKFIVIIIIIIIIIIISGALPMPENLVIMWQYTARPPERPSAPQVYQCLFSHF